jgi:hypothetical protein
MSTTVAPASITNLELEQTERATAIAATLVVSELRGCGHSLIVDHGWRPSS